MLPSMIVMEKHIHYVPQRLSLGTYRVDLGRERSWETWGIDLISRRRYKIITKAIDVAFMIPIPCNISLCRRKEAKQERLQ